MLEKNKIELNNPEILTWAREQAGYSIKDIADYMSKSEEDIVNWESGDDNPTFRQIEKLANKYKRPVATFFLVSIPEASPMPTDFRTLSEFDEGNYSPKSRIAFREARSNLAEARELLDDLGIDIVFSLPRFSLEDDPEQISRKLRELLDVSVEEQLKTKDDYKASDMWRSRLFDFGVLAMVFDMPIEDARGFSLIGSDLAAIGLSNKDTGYPRIFSLFHEVCHLCLRKPGVSGESTNNIPSSKMNTAKIEQFCDKFSASFLLPAYEPKVIKLISKAAECNETKTYYEASNALKVSKYVVLRRALDLGFIENDLYWDLFKKWREFSGSKKSSSGGGDSRRTRISYMGKRFAGLIFEALDANKINTYNASKLLDLDCRHFDNIRNEMLRGAIRE